VTAATDPHDFSLDFDNLANALSAVCASARAYLFQLDGFENEIGADPRAAGVLEALRATRQRFALGTVAELERRSLELLKATKVAKRRNGPTD